MEFVKCGRPLELDPVLDQFIRANGGLFTHSLQWIRFLSRWLGVENESFVALSEGRPRAYLPILVKDGPLGKVANSSPFYGSNGGIIVDQELTPEEQLATKERMLMYLNENARDNALTCIVTNPLYQDQVFYETRFPFQFTDSRVGQLTPLPGTESELLDMYHSKTRNMIRKAQKSGVAVSRSPDPVDLAFLIRTHHQNMEQIGGIPKEEAFFTKAFVELSDHLQLWLARLDGEPVAALLLFVTENVVEYFTPVVRAEYRSMQPLSLLIYDAMKSAVNDHRKWWNWGGTWRTQEGVYRFKERWGTEDKPYQYFIQTAYADAFRGSTKEALLENYRYFYTIPFDALTRNH